MSERGRDSGGPYVQYVVLCERADQQEGRLSLLGLLDMVVFGGEGGAPPLPNELKAFLVIGIRGGRLRGRRPLEIRLIDPSGRERERFNETFEFVEWRPIEYVVLDLALRIEHEGVHWFEVTFEGQVVAKVHLRVATEPPPRATLH